MGVITMCRHRIWWWPGLLIVVAIPLLFMFFGRWGGGWYNYYGYGPGGMMRWPGFYYGGWIGMLFWALIIGLGVYWLVTTSARQPVFYGRSEARDPIDILKERYARGEITKEQFEEMKRDLQ